MDHDGCLEPAELVRFRQGDYGEPEKTQISRHLQACSVCGHNAQLLERVISVLEGAKKSMGPANNKKKTQACLTPERTYQYLEKELDEELRAQVEAHIDECSLCYEAMVSLLRNSLTPATDLEKNEIRKLTEITPEKQVSRVLAYVRTESKAREKAATGQGFWQQISRFFHFPENVSNAWRAPALAALALLLVVAGTYQGIRFYRTSWPMVQAEQLLQQNYRIYMKDTARLSGGYRSSGVAALMSADSESSYTEQALALTQEAARKGANPDQVRKIEAQIYVIQNDYPKAESAFEQIGEAERHSAGFLNDRGVVRFGQQDWERAQQFFEASLKADPRFKEAWYNLALVQEKRQDAGGALSALEHYLALETDEGWRNAALEFKKRLQSQLSF
jgi:tetratricopeptide (TPR) repeat protein